MKFLRNEVLDCLLILVKTLERKALGPILNPMIAISCSLNENSPKSEIATSVMILEYCLISCINDVQNHISSLCNIPNTPEFRKINSYVAKLLEAKTFSEKVTSMAVFLHHEHFLILTNTLMGIKSLLSENEMLLTSKLAADRIDSEFSDLLLILLEVVRKHNDHITIRTLAHECLGILGAVDPFKMVLKDNINVSSGKYNFSVTDNILDFTLFILVRQLVPEYSAASNVQTQSLLAYTIQELLKFIGFSQYAGKTSGHELLISDDSLKLRWDYIPKKYIPILFPLLSSKYSLKDNKKSVSKMEVQDISILPVSLWLKQLFLTILKGISKQNNFHAFFSLIKQLILDTEICLVDHILPCAVLNGITDNTSLAQLIYKEFNNILSKHCDVSKIQVI